MTLLSAVCVSCWANCWPLVLAAFLAGGWLGLLTLALLISAKDRENRCRD